MKQKLLRYGFLLAALLLLCMIFRRAVPARRAYFQLYDRENKVVILELPVQPGDQLRLEIEHSFEHIPWFEYYTITDDNAFRLDAIAVAGYGAGIPAEMDVPTRIEDGLIWMENINSHFDELKWLTSSKYMKELTLNGNVIFDFRTLPAASLIRASIITKKEVLTRG